MSLQQNHTQPTVPHVKPSKLKHLLARDLATGKIQFDEAVTRVRRAGLNGSEAALLETLTQLEATCKRAATAEARHRIIYMMLAKNPKTPTEADFH